MQMKLTVIDDTITNLGHKVSGNYINQHLPLPEGFKSEWGVQYPAYFKAQRKKTIPKYEPPFGTWAAIKTVNLRSKYGYDRIFLKLFSEKTRIDVSKVALGDILEIRATVPASNKYHVVASFEGVVVSKNETEMVIDYKEKE